MTNPFGTGNGINDYDFSPDLACEIVDFSDLSKGVRSTGIYGGKLSSISEIKIAIPKFINKGIAERLSWSP